MSRWGLLLCCGPAFAGLSGCAASTSQCRCAPPPLAPTSTVNLDVPAPPVTGQATRSAKPPDIQPTAAQEPADALPPPRPVVPPPALPGSMPNTYPHGPMLPANPLPGPTAAGALLNLGPNENAVERAVEMAKRLGAAEAERQALLARMQQLEMAVEARDRMLAESAHEVDRATIEMTATREDLRLLKKELTTVSERLRQTEKSDVDSLRSILGALEKLVDPNAPKVIQP